MKKILCSTLIALSCPLLLPGQKTDTAIYSFSLEQAVDYAMKNQPDVLNAHQDELSAKHKVNETKGIGLPQINASFDLKDFVEVPTMVVPANAFNPFAGPDEVSALKFGVRYNATAGIDATQLVFKSDYFIGLQAAKTFLELTKKASQRTRLETTVAVTKAYYTVLINYERLKLAISNVTRITKLLNDTKAMFENGFVEKTDVDRIQVAYNNIRFEKEKIQRLTDLSVSLLKYQLGMDQPATLLLTGKLSDINLQPDSAGFKFDYLNRVEYSLMMSQKNISALQLKRNRLNFLPNMILYGNLSTNAYRNDFDIFSTTKSWYPTVVIGARIGIPVFDGLQNHYRIQQSAIDLLKTENNLKKIRQTIDLEMSMTKTNLQNAQQSLETQMKNMSIAEEIYKTTKTKYEQGVGSSLEVLNAETSLKEAQMYYFSSLFDAIIYQIDYNKAYGNINLK